MNIRSTSRQEIECTNDFVTFAGGNIQLRPGMTTGNTVFEIANPSGIEFMEVDPTNNYVDIGGGPPQAGFLLTVHGDAYADSWITPSSQRWKTNIETIQDPLDIVSKLRGVRYDSKADHTSHVGVIAEEVAKVLPQVVSFEEDGVTTNGVEYSRLTAVLIEAVKAQQIELDDLRAQIELLSEQK